MAKSTTPPPIFSDTPLDEVAPKVAAVSIRLAALRADTELAHQMAQDAQIREALSRTGLTLALIETLKARAAAEASGRRDAIAAMALRTGRLPDPLPPPQPPPPSPPPPTLWQRVSRRLQPPVVEEVEAVAWDPGPSDEARLIADSGLWRSDDLAAIETYVGQGGDPAALPDAPLFDQAWYLATYPAVASSGALALEHYIRSGEVEGAAPHPLFDSVYYRARNGAEIGDGVALAHFVRIGAWLGRDPHPLFDLAWYAAQHPDLVDGEDPISHYLRQGWRDGLSPHPLFDVAWYRRQMPRKAAEVAPLLHYVTVGWRKGLSPHALFDPAWYLEQNADMAQAGLDPLGHFLAGGAAEGRDPSPWFDMRRYADQRGGLDRGINPLVDYLAGGAWRVAEIQPDLLTAPYLAQHPEMVAQGLTPLEHWARRVGSAQT